MKCPSCGGLLFTCTGAVVHLPMGRTTEPGLRSHDGVFSRQMRVEESTILVCVNFKPHGCAFIAAGAYDPAEGWYTDIDLIPLAQLERDAIQNFGYTSPTAVLLGPEDEDLKHHQHPKHDPGE